MFLDHSPGYVPVHVSIMAGVLPDIVYMHVRTRKRDGPNHVIDFTSVRSLLRHTRSMENPNEASVAKHLCGRLVPRHTHQMMLHINVRCLYSHNSKWQAWSAQKRCGTAHPRVIGEQCPRSCHTIRDPSCHILQLFSLSTGISHDHSATPPKTWTRSWAAKRELNIF